MKKQFFFSMLAAAAMLASCSSDEAVVENNGGALVNGEGYVSLAINLPTVSGGTRAQNDVFDDGTANEYAVYDATLVLFKGEDEATATVASAYNLNLNFNTVGTTTDNITSTAQIVQKITGSLGTDEEFYALVVLNSNGQFVVSNNVLEINGADVTGSTLAEVIADTKIALTGLTPKTLVKGNGTSATQFFMANAPLNTVAGGSNDLSVAPGVVTTLPAIDASKIYETEALAAANPATEISVERAVAKVTLTATDGTTTGTAALDYTIQGWQLDNTNEESFLVRNVAGFTANWAPLKTNKTPAIANPFRFVGSTAVTPGLFRTYWGIDPNYGTEMGFTDGQGVTYWDEKTAGAPAYVAADGASHPLYCAENTFDVAHQKDINSTTAILKVKFSANTFYTINKDESALYTESTIVDKIKALLLSNTAITTSINAIAERNTHTIVASDLTVTFTHDDAGIVKVAEIVISGDAFTDAAARNASTIAVASTNALAIINEANVIRRYLGGIAYYPIIIKHFGDDLTPWKAGETTAPSAGNIYPGGAANYLGRYGVLRNNWYDITVTSIKNLGTATVPTLGNTKNPEDDPDGPGNGDYDDDIDEYISVKINILSWAKRTQNVEL